MGKRTPARELMVNAAERLFAERGIDGVSLREVAAEAGQRNNSAAQYHFGDKQGLVSAVFERRLPVTDARRAELLAELVAAGGHLELRALIKTVVTPLTELVLAQPEGSWYLRFLGQLVVTPELHAIHVLDLTHAPAMAATIDYARERLSHLPAQVRDQRLRLATFLVVHALADGERNLDRSEAGVVRLRLLAAALVDSVVALLESPLSPDTAERLGDLSRL